MKITDDDDRDDAPVLPKAAVLEAWTVPEPAADLTDRVLAHVDARQPGARPDAGPGARPGAPVVALPRRRGGLGLAVVGVAMVAAAALVLGLAQLWRASPDDDARAAAVAAPALARAPSSLARAEEPAATSAAATLVVHATPSDASVRIDGRPMAGPSPFVATALPPGPHTLEVERDGYLPVRRTVEGGTPLELPVALQLREVVLELSIDPPDATVRLWADGRATEIGRDGDRHVLRREPGVRYELEATAPGHLSRRVPLAFSGRADEAITLRLAADPSAAPGTPVRISPYLEEPYATRAADREQSLRKPKAKAKPDPKATATLRIGTARGQSPAKVSIDGKPVGTTPLMNTKVAPGRHTVRWTWPDGSTATVKVTLEGGESKVLEGSPGDGEPSSP